MQTNNFNKKKVKQAGFSLIELLVAMVISLTIMFACTALYSSLKSSVTTAQNLAKAQESLRGSFYLMSRSVYQADKVEISGAQLTVTYAAPPTGELYSCLGNSITSTATDTYLVDVDVDDQAHLFCDDGTGAQLIALDVEELQFETIPNTNNNGLKVTMKIDGMPSSYVDGLTFILALRQKVLLDLAE